LAEIGAESFAKIGCAACHQLGGNHKPIPSQLTARPLAKLARQGGCLELAPAKGLPNYQLSEKQSAALAKAIELLQQPLTPIAAPERIVHTMLTMNCYACHQRDGAGGVPRDRDSLFVSDDKDLGDEGRIPPLLTGAGDKLRPEWLATVLYRSGIARPYMHTRMPQFGQPNLASLDTAMVAADLKTDTMPAPPDPQDVARKAGHQLTGKNGLSCISCHMFNRRKSLGIQAMDLASMSERLRADWFYRYMQNPAVFRPGTRMPQAFLGAKSTRKDILDGSTDRQLQALWTYLSDGRKARDPEGLTRQTLELVVGGEAVMYRAFIDGGGTRAIGVGYPEEVNLAFDANEMRLAMIWTGRFIDASRHWNGRGDGFQPPAGENVVKLAAGVPLAVLENAEAPWPTAKGKDAGYQFRGYHLDSLRRPTFRYEVAGIKVDDFPSGAEDKAGRYIVRTLSFSGPAPVANLWYRAAAGKIEPAGDGAYRVNGEIELRVKPDGNASPLVRKAGDNQELLVPVAFDGNQARLTFEYHW
jgi:mono/diheme cytochrome c family protein